MQSKPKETIGGRIALKRTEAGLTQDKLAKMLFVGKQTVSRWERNENEPSFEQLINLSNILNTSCNWILTGNGTENYVLSNLTGLTDSTINILKEHVGASICINRLVNSDLGIMTLTMLSRYLEGNYEEFYLLNEEGQYVKTIMGEHFSLFTLTNYLRLVRESLVEAEEKENEQKR